MIPRYNVCSIPRSQWASCAPKWLYRGEDSRRNVRWLWADLRADAAAFSVYETAQNMAAKFGGVVMQAEVQREFLFSGPSIIQTEFSSLETASGGTR